VEVSSIKNEFGTKWGQWDQRLAVAAIGIIDYVI
jgi:hypothetical protein